MAREKRGTPLLPFSSKVECVHIGGDNFEVTQAALARGLVDEGFLRGRIGQSNDLGVWVPRRNKERERTPPFTWRSGQPTQHIEPERQILTATKIQNVLSISEPCFLAIAIKNENFRLFKRLLPGWVQA